MSAAQLFHQTVLKCGERGVFTKKSNWPKITAIILQFKLAWGKSTKTINTRMESKSIETIAIAFGNFKVERSQIDDWQKRESERASICTSMEFRRSVKIRNKFKFHSITNHLLQQILSIYHVTAAADIAVALNLHYHSILLGMVKNHY